jgi:hypothetical protein
MILKAARLAVAVCDPTRAVKSRFRRGVVRKVVARAPVSRRGPISAIFSLFLR